jgi:hypothetical protein
MRLRQVVLVAPELEPALEVVQGTFGIEESFRDPPGEAGINNCVMPVGDTFLEVLEPSSPLATSSRYLQTTGGAGGYMVIFQFEHLEAAIARAEQHGCRFVMKLEHPDQRQWHIHPKDVGGAIVALDWADPPEGWRWGGDWQNKRHTDYIQKITGVEVSCVDPAERAARWSAVLGIDVSPGKEGSWLAGIDDGEIAFVPWDRGYDRVTGVMLRVGDQAGLEARARTSGAAVGDDQLLLIGTRFYLQGEKR